MAGWDGGNVNVSSIDYLAGAYSIQASSSSKSRYWELY